MADEAYEYKTMLIKRIDNFKMNNLVNMSSIIYNYILNKISKISTSFNHETLGHFVSRILDNRLDGIPISIGDLVDSPSE